MTLSIAWTVPLLALTFVRIILDPYISHFPLIKRLLTPKADKDAHLQFTLEGKLPLETWYNNVLVKKLFLKRTT
jgi:hypothetical protein